MSTQILRACGHRKVTHGFVLWFPPPLCAWQGGGRGISRSRWISTPSCAKLMTVEVMAHYTHPSQVEREDFSVFGAPGQVSVQPPSASLIQEPPRVALTAAPPPLWDPRYHTALSSFKISESSCLSQPAPLPEPLACRLLGSLTC